MFWKTLVCFVCATLFPLSATQGVEIPFSSYRTIDSFFDGAFAVDTADFDRDGDIDVVAAALLAGDIHLWRNNGDGSSWSLTPVQESFAEAHDVHAADVDGDGSTDIVAASMGLNQIRWWRNSHDAKEWTPIVVDDNFAGAGSVSTADIDGDGDLDILAASVDGLVWWRNRTSNGSSWTRHGLESTGAFNSVQAADLDHDGDADILATHPTDGVLWLENADGNGSVWTRRVVAQRLESANAAVAADINGDGKLDVVAAARGSGIVAWWRNCTGDGSTWAGHTVAGDFHGVSSVFADDLDQDGAIDILAAGAHRGEVVWWQNSRADGTAWSPHPLPGTFSGATEAMAADLNRDGDPDVIGVAQEADHIAWWSNETIHRSAAFADQSVVASLVGTPAQIVHADLDGDGASDVVVPTLGRGRLTWWQNTLGDGSSWTEHSVDSDFAGASSMIAADLDGDGDSDLAASGLGGSILAWWQNLEGDGSLWTRHTIDISAADLSSLDKGDVDGDGDTDLVAVSRTENSIFWWQNNGDLQGWRRQLVTSDFDGVRSAQLVDLDGDGDLDLYALSPTGGALLYWLNADGKGATWSRRSGDLSLNRPIHSAHGDFNRDGKTDLAVICQSGLIRWYRNTGRGLSLQPDVGSTFTAGTWIRAADLDLDGDLDLVGADHRGNRIAWWQNLGDGTGWSEHRIATSFNGVGFLEAVDLDGDADLDLLAASADKNLSWWQNIGGQLALETEDVALERRRNGDLSPALLITARHLGRPGDSAIALDTLELRLEGDRGTGLTSPQADSLLSRLSIYLDNGDRLFRPGEDVEAASVETPMLVHGELSLGLTKQPETLIPFGTARSYFVVAHLQSHASLAVLDQIRITHLIEASSPGRDARSGIPLTLEPGINVSSTLTEINDPPSATEDMLVVLEDRQITGNVIDGTAGGLDTDEEFDSFVPVLSAIPVYGSLPHGLAADGGFIYLPPPNFSGEDHFYYAPRDTLSFGRTTRVSITVLEVNDPPIFLITPEHRSTADAGPQSIADFADSISPGPESERNQKVRFQIIDNSHESLFQVPPALSADGTLTYTAAPGAIGSATLKIRLIDDGGTANGGVDRSFEDSFTITVVPPKNDKPSSVDKEGFTPASARSPTHGPTQIEDGPNLDYPRDRIRPRLHQARRSLLHSGTDHHRTGNNRPNSSSLSHRLNEVLFCFS